MVKALRYLLSFFALFVTVRGSAVISFDQTKSRILSWSGTAVGNPPDASGPTHPRSTPMTSSVLSADVSGAAEGGPAPEAAYQWIVRLLAVCGMLLGYRMRAQKLKKQATQSDDPEATEHGMRSRSALIGCSADTAPLSRQVSDGYNGLKDGTASTKQVDELRRSARSFLTAHHGQAQTDSEARSLLAWLDYARTSGRITVTIQQLRARKMGSWDIEYGIDAGGQAIRAKKSVNGTFEVDGCVLSVPWDADVGIHLWMHLTDSGYESCWGRVGPIGMSSAEVLQDPSGISRVFHTDEFDKDFKLVFKIQRNFRPLPCLESTPRSLNNAAIQQA